MVDEVIKEVLNEINPEADEKMLVAKFQEDTGRTLYPAQSERIFISIISYMANIVMTRIVNVFKMFFVRYASIFFLRLWGEMLGCEQLDAKQAKDTLQIRLYEPFSTDKIIPKGTQVQTKDGEYIFITDEDCIIPAGYETGKVNITSELAGAKLNDYTAGEINILIQNYEYVESVTNINGASGGADIESTERYRARLLLAPERFSTAGSDGAYEYIALSAHQDILDVKAVSLTPGVVTIYVHFKDSANEYEIISAVQDAFKPKKVRPTGIQVLAQSAEKFNYIFNAEVTLTKTADYETVQKAINKALDDYFAELKTKLNESLVPSQICTLINNIQGVFDTTTDDYTVQGGIERRYYNVSVGNITIRRIA